MGLRPQPAQRQETDRALPFKALSPPSLSPSLRLSLLSSLFFLCPLSSLSSVLSVLSLLAGAQGSVARLGCGAEGEQYPWGAVGTRGEGRGGERVDLATPHIYGPRHHTATEVYIYFH